MTCTQAFKQHTNENWRTSRMQWEIVILLHSRRRSKKQQAVGPVGSRGSKLDKTTPTVEKFQGRRELQFLWDGWFKKAILLSVMECRNPYRFRMFVFVGLQLPRLVLRYLFEVKATFQTRLTKDSSNIYDRFQALCFCPRCSSFQLSDYSLLALVEWLTLWD